MTTSPGQIATPADVLAFWREAGPDKWFAKDDAFDAAIRQTFAATYQAAAAGELSAWEATAEGALALGLWTRLVAFILCGDMAVAYFMSHAPRGLYPLLNGGDAAILYCFIFLVFVFAGGGCWSLDRTIWKR